MLSSASRAARSSAPKGYFPVGRRAFTRSCLSLAQKPNAPIPLDPSMQALLQDMSLHNLKHPPIEPRELEAFPVEAEEQELAEELVDGTSDMHRKSPAALYGSESIGAVVLPSQLRSAVTSIIEASDKSQLHNDAVRLFATDSDGDKSGWQIQMDTKYRSYKQGARHKERDATAFASIALPGHYSAIYSVLDHLKHRMEPGWTVDRVIDWGAGSYSGLWASLYSFQNRTTGMEFVEMDELDAAQSTIKNYVGIDKREGLVHIASRLLKGIPVSPALAVTARKTLKDEDILPREAGDKTLAMSSFILSSLPNPLQRKRLVKEMWESGAYTMVLIDHDTKAGFDAVAQAREYILKLGNKELEDPEKESLPIRGVHVVAPCSHDKPCPLFSGETSRLVCGFSQRWQRPAFVRLTKHAKLGHEDVHYSYVIIQRGARPNQITTHAGRLGRVGARAVEEQIAKATPVKQLSLYDEGPTTQLPPVPELVADVPEKSGDSEGLTPIEDLQSVLRQEAYHWPRLVFPPMKKSGHVILDSCTPEGKIMRLTIPKSQGKQPYYDARKSSWGDLFPHSPKNAPQERVVIRGASGKVKSVVGQHIGKSRPEEKLPQKNMYESVRSSVREAKQNQRRWDRSKKMERVWRVYEE